MAEPNENIEIGSLPIPLPAAHVEVEPKASRAAAVESSDPENYDIPDEAYRPEEDFEMPPDDPYRRREVIRQISSYKTLFGSQLTEIKESIQHLDTESLPRLEELLLDVQFMVESRQSIKMARGTFISGITMIEAISPVIGLRLEGLSVVSAQSENLLECVDEIYIKHAPKCQDPIHRLGFELARLCYTLDAHNRARDAKLTPTQETLATGL